MFGSVRQLVLGISPEETTVARRGFRVREARLQARIERIGRVFAEGYHAALADDRPERLAMRLDAVPEELRGFAYEGGAMGLAMLDALLPWKRDRIQRFLAGPGQAHAYMVHVAVGWVVARLPLNIARARSRLDPLLGWLVLDGYGFHEGFFRWPRYLQGQAVPRRLRGYEQRVFDQGLGRSLWFVDGADVTRLPQTIAGFPAERQPDLWSGVGLACGYAGGVEEAAFRALAEAAGPHLPMLAQGVTFAAKARHRAGNISENTRLACRVICGLSAEQAARLTDEALENLPADGSEPAYEIWRRRLQARWARCTAHTS